MRRAVRILLTALTASSLVVAVLLAGLWLRSYWRKDTLSVTWASGGGGVPCYRHVHMVGGAGEVSVEIGSDTQPWPIVKIPPGRRWATAATHGPRQPSDVARDTGNYSALGFSYLGPDKFPGGGRTSGEWTTRTVVPWWGPTAVVGSLNLLCIGIWMRRRRAADRGLCSACGYDLRASPDRCPECGTVVPTAA